MSEPLPPRRPATPPLVGPPPSFSAPAEPPPARRPAHPASRARKVAAGVSVAAFAALAGGLAVQASDSPSSTSSTSPAPGATTATVPGDTVPSGATDSAPYATPDDGTGAEATDGFAPDDGGRPEQGWGAVPGAPEGGAPMPGAGPSTQSHGS